MATISASRTSVPATSKQGELATSAQPDVTGKLAASGSSVCHHGVQAQIAEITGSVSVSSSVKFQPFVRYDPSCGAASKESLPSGCLALHRQFEKKLLDVQRQEHSLVTDAQSARVVVEGMEQCTAEALQELGRLTEQVSGDLDN